MTNAQWLDSTEAAPLTSTEQKHLGDLEGIITGRLQSFLDVGSALLTIRDERLYRVDHTSFEAYLNERWPDITRRRAYQLMEAAEIAVDVNHGTQTQPENERQVRPLAGLPKEERAEAWNEAVATAPAGKVTGAHVQQVVEQRKPQPTPPPAPPKVSTPIVARESGTAAPALPAPATMPPALPIPAPAATTMPPALPMTQEHRELKQAVVASKLLFALYQMADLRAIQLEREAEGVEIELDPMQVNTSAHLFLDSPSWKATVSMLSFSAKVKEGDDEAA